ncbi:conjugal transfer protein [Schaedlerella arabinosiphila]|uniref:Conjugal transfer protein n=1 Tax=Schaedlerella arabinosiphila TaxID=2044587 RepID=A0A426DI62_9FIRM|nr:cysteine-rich KTR domain-containing protein [Schaedlerella arabinosiphila]MCI9211843.1 conjugal transfer protein [Ruminococcus sp.]RRK32509.1 conjugal transfer protein [Schaedlerella arabinosiphila]
MNHNESEQFKWLLCPVCRSKTRIKMRSDTELRNFPLFCPKCKQEILISVTQFHISVIVMKRSADCTGVAEVSMCCKQSYP